MSFPSYLELLKERREPLPHELEQALRAVNRTEANYYDAYGLDYRAADQLKELGYSVDECRTLPSKEQPYGVAFLRITLEPGYRCDADNTLEYLEPAGEYRPIARP